LPVGAKGAASGDAAELARPELDVEGQHQLDMGIADGLVEQLVNRGLPLQLVSLFHAHSSTICDGQARES